MEWTMELGLKILGRLKLEMEALMTQLTLQIPNLPMELLLQCVNLISVLNQQDN